MRLVSYLCPGLPEELFEGIAAVIGSAVGDQVEVGFVTDRSGPTAGIDPLGEASADLAAVCAPAYVDLRKLGQARLVPAAPVFADPRNNGRPECFSEVVVHRDSPARGLADLHDAHWAVNDDRSLSGYWCVVDTVGPGAALTVSGSHQRSITMVANGAVDAAAIDANVWRRFSSSELRVVHTLGPYPVQPLIAHPSVPAEVLASAARALLQSGGFEQLGVAGFAAVTDDHYASRVRAANPTWRTMER